MKHCYCYPTPIGKLWITDEEDAICGISTVQPDDIPVEETTVIREAACQLAAYFEGKLTEFDIPLNVQGTEFQLKVWNALMNIPYGETRTYKDIAEYIGSPRSCRAVGLANNRNPVMVIIPCHRVIGADGNLTGYAGGLDKKKLLLALESGK